MKHRVAIILKIIGIVLVLGAVAYNISDGNQKAVFGLLLIVGIILIMTGRITDRISNGSNDDDED